MGNELGDYREPPHRKYPSPEPELVKQAMRQAHEILPGLAIGCFGHCKQANEAGYTTISVRQDSCGPWCLHRHYLDLNTFEAMQDGLDAFADTINELWYCQGRKVLVHCMHGIERAPLAVAYAIKRDVMPKLQFEEIYSFICRVRPVAQERTLWLPTSAREAVGL